MREAAAFSPVQRPHLPRADRPESPPPRIPSRSRPGAIPRAPMSPDTPPPGGVSGMLYEKRCSRPRFITRFPEVFSRIFVGALSTGFGRGWPQERFRVRMEKTRDEIPSHASLLVRAPQLGMRAFPGTRRRKTWKTRVQQGQQRLTPTSCCAPVRVTPRRSANSGDVITDPG